MSAASLRVLMTTLQHWVPGFSDETEEDHPFLALLKSHGNIDYNASGTEYHRTVKFARLNLAGYADLQRLRWGRNNLFKKMVLPWRGLKMTDAMSDLEMRQNRGTEARVRCFTNKLQQMKDDADDDLGKFFYYDGNAPAHNTKLHGIQSFMSTTGGVPTDAFATTLNDTYAGLSTARGAYGGTVKGGGTPAGENFESTDPEWDFFSPVCVNATYNDGAAWSWAQNAVQLLGRAITHAVRGKARSHQLDVFVMDRQNFNSLKDQLRSKERILVNPGKDRSRLVSLGFDNVIQVDGVDCITDPDIPALAGDGASTLYAYGLNFKKCKLCLLPEPGKKRKKMFWNSSGSYWDPNEQAFKYYVGLWGQLVWLPRHQVEIAAYA